MTFKRYDFSIDNLRDVTEADIQRWKDMEASHGVFFPMQRAMMEASKRLWNGDIELKELWALRDVWLDKLGLDTNGKPKP